MHIESLYLRHFRNCQEETFNFSPHVNLIRGENAQGKTNLLEALFLVGTGRSFRTTHFKELIYKDAPFFFIEALLNKDGIQHKVRLSFDGEVKKLETNHTSYSHFNPLLGYLPIVLLAPEDVLLISGAPADRRRFLDLHLAQSDPLYVYHITRYHKAIKHRNFLLKQKKENELEPWETLMIAAATYIRDKRRQLIDELKDDLQASMLQLSKEKDQIEIRYHPSFTDNYLKHRARELYLGATLFGPHRDDLEILINGLPASSYASQGQLRSAVAALRLTQWKNLAKKHQSLPLFCIDDFGIHLDEERRETLLIATASFGQVFLTSPVFLEGRPYHTLQISSGALQRASLDVNFPQGDKMLFHEAKQILEQHKKDLLQLGVRTLAIFGSVVRNEATAKSDIDVLIDFDATKGLFGFSSVKRFLEKLLDCEVDLVTKKGLHPALKDQILQEAQYVF